MGNVCACARRTGEGDAQQVVLQQAGRPPEQAAASPCGAEAEQHAESALHGNHDHAYGPAIDSDAESGDSHAVRLSPCGQDVKGLHQPQAPLSTASQQQQHAETCTGSGSLSELPRRGCAALTPLHQHLSSMTGLQPQAPAGQLQVPAGQPQPSSAQEMQTAGRSPLYSGPLPGPVAVHDSAGSEGRAVPGQQQYVPASSLGGAQLPSGGVGRSEGSLGDRVADSAGLGGRLSCTGQGKRRLAAEALSELEADTSPGLAPQQARNAYLLGCPPPPCQQGREQTADGIYALKQLQNGEIESMLRLLCSVFETETATLSFLTGECIHIVQACGALGQGICPSRWGFCGWSFVNPNHELLVVEDLTQDTRFSGNFFIVSPDFHLRFYAAAPLIASNGHRLGTLCILAQQPRCFDATRATMLANMGELMVRQLEHQWALREARASNARLMRMLSCYDAPFLFVDAQHPGEWRVLHMNLAAIRSTGFPWTAGVSELASFAQGRPATSFVGVPLAHVLNVPHAAMAPDLMGQPEFSISSVTVVTDEPVAKIAYDLHFKLATRTDGIDGSQIQMGAPAELREDAAFGQHFYMLALAPPAAGMQDVLRGQVQPELQRPALPAMGPFEGLLLGALLGRGSFGRVYRGLHNGRRVAVKVITDVARVRLMPDGRPLEAVMTEGLQHLGVMQTLGWAMHTAADGCKQCWMLMELLDKGSLGGAVLKGHFRTDRDALKGHADFRAIAVTALEVASAMAFLHGHDIVHGDLSGGNVMLTSSPTNLHGFMAKVADFGLARELDPDKRVDKNAYGTVTHMPPEALLNDEVTWATDVYSWGVLLWEMLAGTNAWAGLRHAQIICQVAMKRRQLAIPAQAPPALASLCRQALSFEPSGRPRFAELVEMLQRFLQETRSIDFTAGLPEGTVAQQDAGISPSDAPALPVPSVA